MDYHTVKRIDNTRLVRHAAPARLRDLWRICAGGAAIAACLLFYAWQHFECIQTRYQVEQLESQRAKAVQLNQQLHLEVASLRSPMRVDTIARNQLGLTVPVPGQVAPADGQPSDAVVAEAQSASEMPRP
jgi:cell division protein FtsL